MDFVLKNTVKVMGEHGIDWGSKTLLDLDYADDLSILDENVDKLNDFFKILLKYFLIFILSFPFPPFRIFGC